MKLEYVAKNGFGEFDNNEHLTFEREDKNGTRYYTDCRCPKCGGSGKLEWYYYVEGGICFYCGGTGVASTEIVVRTPEYEEVLRQRRIKKLSKEAPAKNAKFFDSLGLSPEGKGYVVLGDTYDIKDELKAAGARYNTLYGWHFDHMVDSYPVAELTPDTVLNDKGMTLMHTNIYGEYYFAPDTWEIESYIKRLNIQHKLEGMPETNYVGNVGDKVELDLTLEKSYCYEGAYGYRWTYVFADENGNKLVWKSSVMLEQNDGDKLHIKGTIKEHSEYEGVKQTVLTRCKVA